MLITRYQQAIEKGEIAYDPKQLIVLEALQTVLINFKKKQSVISLLSKPTIPGLYFWGKVGVGKTYLMDLFYHALPTKRKMRQHFHEFMRDIHLELRKRQGEPNPLEKIAKSIGKKVQLLCLDEFVVNDIADAMILERLLKALFKAKITLVTTSNISPDKLYWQGLQRTRFLPAIDLIKKNCAVLAIDSEEDHRLRKLTQTGVYFNNAQKDNETKMIRCFELIAKGEIKRNVDIEVERRNIKTRYLSDNCIWFDFKVLCSPPRSQMDYLILAKQFDAIFLSNVPKIKAYDLSSITYFILLIDVLYDNNTVLVMSLDASLEEIYQNGEKSFEFQRTLSRLIEMQSLEYIRERISLNLNENDY